MKGVFGIKDDKIVADYHVHVGQFNDVYYQPATVIKTLADNGIKETWISSTTGLRADLPEEIDYIVNHINEEIEEALAMAKRYGMKVTPLYRVVPKFLIGGRVEEILYYSPYQGFKLHPWDDGYENDSVNPIVEEVCRYASKKQFPILIHTGEDARVLPSRFEQFFKRFQEVKFVLAHCKEAEKVIPLLEKHENVFGDTAFCPGESLKAIRDAGLINKMQFGTDFPITHWFGKEFGNRKNNLSQNYKNILNDWK